MKTNGKKKLKFCGKLLEIKKKFEKGNLLLKKKLLRLKLIQKKLYMSVSKITIRVILGNLQAN